AEIDGQDDAAWAREDVERVDDEARAGEAVAGRPAVGAVHVVRADIASFGPGSRLQQDRVGMVRALEDVRAERAERSRSWCGSREGRGVVEDTAEGVAVGLVDDERAGIHGPRHGVGPRGWPASTVLRWLYACSSDPATCARTRCTHAPGRRPSTRPHRTTPAPGQSRVAV